MKHIAWTVVLLTVMVGMNGCRSGRGMSAEEFREASQEFARHTTTIEEKRQQIADIISALNQSTPGREPLRVVVPGSGLSDAQVTMLRERMDQEHDEAAIAMLEHALDLSDEIVEECSDLRDLAHNLPDPHVVRPGETHYGLCLNFLQKQHGLSRAQADSIIDRVALTSDLVEGFNVWLLYSDGFFGTFVTQGNATISPNAFARVMRRQAMETARREGAASVLDSLQHNNSLPATITKPLAGTR